MTYCENCKKPVINWRKGRKYCSISCSNKRNKNSRKEITWKKDNEKGCFICTSHKPDQNGYYPFRRNNKRTRIHRYLYEQKYGSLKNKIIIRHKCDNPSCINLEHLEMGTKADNSRDMVERGRVKRGRDLPQTKLTEIKAKEIYDSKQTTTFLSKKYSIARRTIREIKQRLIWKHIHKLK